MGTYLCENTECEWSEEIPVHYHYNKFIDGTLNLTTVHQEVPC